MVRLVGGEHLGAEVVEIDYLRAAERVSDALDDPARRGLGEGLEVQRAQMPRAADGVEPLDLEQDGLRVIAQLLAPRLGLPRRRSRSSGRRPPAGPVRRRFPTVSVRESC